MVRQRTLSAGARRRHGCGCEGCGSVALDGATAIFVAIDSKAAGIIAIADPIKLSTPEALAALKAEGLHVVMLTGDNWTTARAVARQLGIDQVEAEVLPEQKREIVRLYKEKGAVVAKAGDGVNDAHACGGRCRDSNGNGYRRGH